MDFDIVQVSDHKGHLLFWAIIIYTVIRKSSQSSCLIRCAATGHAVLNQLVLKIVIFPNSSPFTLRSSGTIIGSKVPCPWVQEYSACSWFNFGKTL